MKAKTVIESLPFFSSHRGGSPLRHTRIVLFLLSLGVCSVAGAQWQPTTAPPGPIYYDGGNVGIGTSTPNLTNGNTPGLVIYGSYPALRLWAIGAGARGYQLSTGSNGQFTIVDTVAGASRLTLDSTGRFGIGTSFPGAKLHVSDDTDGGYASSVTKA